MKYLKPILVILTLITVTSAQYTFDFEKDLKSCNLVFKGDNVQFTKGIKGFAVRLDPKKEYSQIYLENISLDASKDFTVLFWIKTNSDRPAVFISQKDFKNKSIGEQKNPGWALYSSGGTLAWCIGSGKRRINYERSNGNKMPIDDGKWHQLALTYSQRLTEARLYFDGRNVAIYKVGFDFTNQESLTIGTTEHNLNYRHSYLPQIMRGAANLQKYVDSFNQLGAGTVNADEFISLIVNPEKLYKDKMITKGKSDIKTSSKKFEKLDKIRKKLYNNPYTVYQNRNLTKIKPVNKIYSLKDNKIIINDKVAREFTVNVELHPADFSIDQLSIHERVLSSNDIMQSYLQYGEVPKHELNQHLDSIIVGVWNIWHGGIHWTREKDGWDSRQRIVEILEKNNVDIVLMQETYSSGDFIAAELDYYFATTSDWDYCFQGSNISILSRFPIKDLFVSAETEFNNLVAKLALGESQELYAMSNWYGMNAFTAVYNFNQSRFNESDTIPVLFGGDFNAVPHTDGGESPASRILLANGFTDAYRSLHPDVEQYPGYTHQSGRRIDQLYYKGKDLINRTTEIISEWPGGFPSDHNLIISKFDIK